MKSMKKAYQNVANRDKNTCQVCGHRANHVHHIVYRSHCGNNDERNLICLCMTCHEKAHQDEKPWRETFLKHQRRRYGDFDIEELKK